MNDDALEIATPIDAYVAVGRRLGLELGYVTQLRRTNVWNRLSTGDAEEMVDALCRIFGEELTAQLIKGHPADYRMSLKNIEPRVSRLLSMCRGLNRRDVLRMMLKSTKVFTVDTETFLALIDAAIKLLPDESHRWTFLYAYPGYFALNPVIVGESVARGVTESAHRGDHVALWNAINNESEQTAWLALTKLLRTLKYRDILRARYLERLYKDLGSYDAGMKFVSDLIAAGWLPEDIRATLGVYTPYRRAGSRHIIALQELLITRFGLRRYQVVAALMKRPVLLFAPLEFVTERILAALPDPRPDLVERLLHHAPMVLQQAAERTNERRQKLEETDPNWEQHLSLLADRRAMSSGIPEEPEELEEPPSSDATRSDSSIPPIEPPVEPPALLANPFADMLYGQDPHESERTEHANTPETPLVRPERFEDSPIFRTLGGLGVSRNVRKAFATRLLHEFGSAEEVQTFLDRLRDAGWEQEARRLMITKRMTHRKIGAEGLISLQTRLAREFNLMPHTAAMIVASHPELTTLHVDTLCDRIHAAIPEPTRPQVEGLLNCTARILDLSAMELTRRRRNLLARGVDPSKSPRMFTHRIAVIDPPPKRVVIEKTPVFNPEPEPPPPPPTPARPRFANVIEAIEAVGWTHEDALVHQDIFYEIKKLDPHHVYVVLTAIKEFLGLMGATFTNLLLTNLYGMIRRRDELKAAYRESRETRGSLDNIPFTSHQTTDACRIAVGIYSVPAVDESLGLLRRYGLTTRQATTILADHPELLTDDARPLAVMYWFDQTCQMSSAHILPNLNDPDSRMALFLDPDSLRKKLNAQRSLVTDFDDLNLEPYALDPCVRWSRFFCPVLELEARLRILNSAGWSWHHFQKEALEKSRALQQEQALQLAVTDALYAPSRKKLKEALHKQRNALLL